MYRNDFIQKDRVKNKCMQRWKTLRCFSADVQTIPVFPFMIKCPVCHFQDYSLEGANAKLFSLLTLARQKWTKQTAACLFIDFLSISSKNKRLYTANKAEITFQIVYYRKVAYTLLITVLWTNCSCWETVTLWKLFILDEEHSQVAGGHNRVFSKAKPLNVCARRCCGSILHAGIFLISSLRRVCLSDVVMPLISEDGLMNHKKPR